MKAGSKELIEEAEIFFSIFNHKLSTVELKDILQKQGIRDVSLDELLYSDNEAFGSAQWNKIRKFQWLFRYLPYVEMVAVCNAVAMNTADHNSDIDLFVVTKDGRIFTARVLMTLVFHLLGIRRHGKKVASRFCLTFFVTDESMRLKVIAKNEDIYLKYWLLTLKPLFGRMCFKTFMYENGVQNVECPEFKGKSWIIKLLVHSPLVIVGDFIEKRLKILHLRRWERLKKRIGKNHGIVISDNMLKFHNIDMRDYFREEFKKRGGKYIDTISFF